MSKIGKREVPMTRSQQRKLLGDHLSFAAAEAYKLLRTNLMFALPDSGGCRVVGVTSALQGEGKSTTSMNTAYTIAETGQRVLLIEADMRLPNVARCLGLRPNLGLSDLLAAGSKTISSTLGAMLRWMESRPLAAITTRSGITFWFAAI